MNFKVKNAENGIIAFTQVRKFIERYNQVHQFLQRPGEIQNRLNKL